MENLTGKATPEAAPTMEYDSQCRLSSNTQLTAGLTAGQLLSHTFNADDTPAGLSDPSGLQATTCYAPPAGRQRQFRLIDFSRSALPRLEWEARENASGPFLTMIRRTIAILFVALAALAQEPPIYHPKPPDPREFPIFAWGGSPSDPQLLEGMKEAGFTVSGFCSPKDLDKVRAAGLSCYVQDSRISLTREQWENLPPEAELRKNIASLVHEVGNHPAALGYCLMDEPNAPMMNNLAHVAAILRELAPGKLPYVNLFPTYASRRRFLPVGYEKYVRMVVDDVKCPFISYDLYALAGGEMMDRFFTNLEIIRRISLEKSVPFWNCVLANAHFSYMEPTDATIHLQAYATLAYGGRGVEWFTYMGYPNMRLSAVDVFGHRTPTWGMLQRMNMELHALAPTLLKLHSTGVYHYPDIPEQGKSLAESQLVKSVEMVQDFHHPPTAARLLVGELQDAQGRPYVLIVNKDLKNAFRFHVEWKIPEHKVFTISSWSGQEEPLAQDMNWLAPGSGMLLRVE